MIEKLFSFVLFRLFWGALVLGLTFGAASAQENWDIIPTIILPSETNAAAQALESEFGISPGFLELTSGQGRKYYYFMFHRIAPGSIAEDWGLQDEYVVIDADSTRRPFIDNFISLSVNHTSIAETPETISAIFELYLEVLRDPEHYVNISVVPAFQLYQHRVANRRDMRSDEATGSILLANNVTTANPQQIFVDHLGFDLNEALVVTEIIPNSPADIAGIEPGDVFGGRIGNGGVPSTWTRAEILQWASERLERNVGYGPLNFRFVRNGQEQSYPLPAIRRGEVFSELQLEDGERAVFELLPPAIRQFYTYIYLGDFEAAEPLQMYIFDQIAGNSVLTVTRLFGAYDDFRDAFEASRGRGVFTHYILTKSNALGLCGAPGTDLRVEQERYEVWVDQYGIEVSSRREIEPLVYEFTVPEQWAGALRETSPMGEVRQWRGDVIAFLRAAGGCDSSLLAQLESNMLAYLATAR
ncbi:MAG: hypothetical protein AAGF88_05590 [Pseudomonadota bacterium]